jgi:hypothetical protein
MGRDNGAEVVEREWYEVRDVSPPAKNLGMFPFPPNTQCGAVITVDPKDALPPQIAQYFSKSTAAQIKKSKVKNDDEGEMTSPGPEDAAPYVVKKVTSRYVLVSRKYVPRGPRRLHVKPQGRYFIERQLENMMEKSGGGDKST